MILYKRLSWTLIALWLASLPLWAQTPSGARGTTPPRTSTREEERVSLNVKDAPLNLVLDMLFRGRKVSYVIDPQVTATTAPITAQLVDVPFEVALNQILRASGLRAVKSQNVYTILPRLTPEATGTTSPTAPPVPTTPGTETTTPTSVAQTTVTKIPLLVADPAEIAQVLGGAVISGSLIGGLSGVGFGGFGGFGGLGGLGGFGSFGTGLGGFGTFGGLGSLGGFGTFGGLGGFGGLGSFGSFGTGLGGFGGLGTFGGGFSGLGTTFGTGFGTFR